MVQINFRLNLFIRLSKGNNTNGWHDRSSYQGRDQAEQEEKLMGGEKSAEKFEYCFANCSLFSMKNRENCFQENIVRLNQMDRTGENTAIVQPQYFS